MDELEKELELARSKVRRRISYGAGIVLGIMFLWGMMWMQDRSVAIAGIELGTAIISYWFGFRSGQNTKKE